MQRFPAFSQHSLSFLPRRPNVAHDFIGWEERLELEIAFALLMKDDTVFKAAGL